MAAHRKTYVVWYDMKRRCSDPNTINYKYYGAKGIKYDPHWEIFNNFFEDMGECPEGWQLDRIDNEKGYSKENCRWATRSEQCLGRGIRSTNTSGCTGVYFYKRNSKWKATIMVEGVRYTIGTFKTKEEAISARKAAEEQVKLP